MTSLGKKLAAISDRGQTARIAYGVMASATTVNIEGSTTAVTVPQLASAGVLESGDYVAVQIVGADALIIGRVGGPRAQSGIEVVNTDASGDYTFTFPVEFDSAPDVVATRYSGASTQVGIHLRSVTTTGFIARFTQNDVVQTSATGVAFGWFATI